MTKKLMMMAEYPQSEASAGGGSMRGTVAVAFGAWAYTETVGGDTWTQRINGGVLENMV